jgi:oligopeptide/dipeptide ABC transporter ATP-binding protein
MAERSDHAMPIAPVSGPASAAAASGDPKGAASPAPAGAVVRPAGPAAIPVNVNGAAWRGDAGASPAAPASAHDPAATLRPRAEPGTGVVLEVRDLKKHFPVKKGLLRRTVGHVYAVDGVSFTIGKGETLGLVGESGCGKTTVGRTLLRLVEPTSGEILLEGRDVSKLTRPELRPFRREMQIIFQDPFSSLDPRMSAGSIVGEPLRVHGVGDAEERRTRVAELFARVGLRPQQMDNFPHQFSGGQRQRLGIARALALNPKLIIGDEPVSALDVSIQAQVINILKDLQKDLGLSYLFISHNLAVVEHISHRIAVMYLGRIVEYADKRTLFTSPRHPYTEALLSAVPVPDPAIKRSKVVLQGDVPSPVKPPPGCHFHTRCPLAEARCRQEAPKLRDVGRGQLVACHLR